MNPEADEAIHKMCLRGDTVSYLAQLLEDYTVAKLRKAFACTTYRSGPDSHDPIVHGSDIAFLSKLDEVDTGKSPYTTTPAFVRFTSRSGHNIVWNWPANNCADLLSPDESRLLIRRLAYRAGICKICGCAFRFAVSDFLHTMACVLIDAFESTKGLAPKSINCLDVEDTRYITSDQAGDASQDSIPGQFGAFLRTSTGEVSLEHDYYQKMCPPFLSDENGKIICVIIPRQIQDAASRIGLKPVYGYTSIHPISSVFYESGEGRTREQENDEAMSQYYVEGDGHESVQDMSIDSDDTSNSDDTSDSDDTSESDDTSDYDD